MLVKKALDAQQPDPEEANEDPQEEAQETPDQEAAEEQGEQGEAGDEQGRGNVSPEEQAIYNAVVIAAETMIYQQPYRDVTLQKLKANHDNLPLAIGHTAAMIVLAIQGGAKKENKDIPDDVLFAAGQEIVADLVEVATAAKLAPESETKDLFTKSLFVALKEYGESAKVAGYVTSDTQNEAKDAMGAMMQQAGAKGAPPPAPGGAVAAAMPAQPQQSPQQPQPQGAPA